MSLLKDLNQEQLSAVMHKNGSLLIVAGAGTGKTTVIAQRIAYLIEQGLTKADEILALTFTEKAAAEMEARVGALLPVSYFDLWISTFHSFGEKILKEHGLTIGLPTDFKLFNEFEQWALIKKNLDKFNLDYYCPLGNPTKFIQALIKHFGRAKDENISPTDYLKYAEELMENLDNMLSGNKNVKSKCKTKKFKTAVNDQQLNINLENFYNADNEFDQNIAKQEIARVNEVANAYHVYQQLLLDNNALDFGDLINYCLKLFKSRPAVLEKYKKQFKFILLDEFQDTNWAQYELIKLLINNNKNLVVVGDDDQAIFRFRGASMSNILQFKKDFPESKEIILTKNYRSNQNILDLSYNFIKLNNPNRLEWQLNQKSPKQSIQHVTGQAKAKSQKLNKKLIAQNEQKGEIEVINKQTLSDEIKQVIEKIIELKIKDKICNWNDFAILVRANDSAKVFINELEQAQLPYIFGASRGLYLKPLIIDVISYFKLLDNYHESRAVYRILNLPIFSFTYQELINFNFLAYKKAWSLYETLINANIWQPTKELLEKINKVLALINKHTNLVKSKTVSEIFLAFMNDSGYLQYLTSQDDQVSKEAINLLNQFMKRIKAFEASSDDKSVKSFLEELSLEIEAGGGGNLDVDLDIGPEAIKILTVHGAKGLEFKYVFVVNLVDKRFPTIERSEQIELPNALIKEILPTGDIHLQEERRLFYVAMTRAKTGLYFSLAKDYGGLRKKKPSRFLEELGLINNNDNDLECSNKSQNLKLTPPAPSLSGKISIQKSITVPSYFSYTQLVAFSHCPYQYRFAHILKIPVSGKEQFSFGKTLHITLQKLFSLINEKKGLRQANLFSSQELAENITLEEVLELYKNSWIDDWYESKKKKEERYKQGQKILTVFYKKYKNNWPKTLFLEKGFNVKLADDYGWNTIRGVIDRIDQVGSKIKIVDYKTGQPKSKLTFDEKEQLFIYQIAVEEIFKQPVASLAFYYLDNNTEVEFLGDKDDLAKVKEKVILTISKIKKGVFPPQPSQLCKFCDFKNICEFRQS
ncbi:MAG: UvrD-helicase domain-containing protein [Patescibacteria group bacterium]